MSGQVTRGGASVAAPHPRVAEALAAHGAPHRVIRHAELEGPVRSPADVAAALGIEVGEITKTLLVHGTTSDRLALVVCAMTDRLDLDRVGRVLGEEARMATADELAAALPYPRTGVSPLGVEGLPVFVDEGVAALPGMLVGGGVPGVEIELTGGDLLELTGAEPLHLVEGSPPPAAATIRPRMLSGIQPSGTLHLGNLLGAVAQWRTRQHSAECFVMIADLHALTALAGPGEIAQSTLRTAASLLAAGLDPQAITLFAQSHVTAHSRLAWLLNAIAPVGDLRRLPQFKEKSARSDPTLALLAYPVLQAADILLYDTDEVPVGDDQRQHLELARELARRFNARHGATFRMPRMVTPAAGARVMDLLRPEAKMSKTGATGGVILISDDAATIAAKVRRARTDSGDRVTDTLGEGVRNLLDLHAAVCGEAFEVTHEQFLGRRYGDLKADVAAAVNAYLAPIRSRLEKIVDDEEQLVAHLAAGASAAAAVADPVIDRASKAIGLLPRASKEAGCD